MNNKKTILRTLAIVLGVILVINSFGFFLRIRDSFYIFSGYTYTDLLRSIEEENYPLVADMAYRNEARGKTEKENTKEFLYFAKYYEASMLYKAYLDVGDSKNASLKKQKMDEYIDNITTPEIIDAVGKL